jgi:hypothetical protein
MKPLRKLLRRQWKRKLDLTNKPALHKEINSLAQQFNFDMESRIERAIDLLVEHDYVDGEGEQWRPRIKRKGNRRTFGRQKSFPVVVQ